MKILNLFKKRKIKEVKKSENYHSKYKDYEIHIFLLVERPCYDTDWIICIKKAGESDIIERITRLDNETAENIDNEIRSLSEITSESLRSLDKKDCIYYD